MNKSITLHHEFDAKLARNIGEQSVSSNIQAIIELVKNSFDADASDCKIHLYANSQQGENIKMSKIVIEDNGIGMTVEDFKQKWMRVATNYKLDERYSPINERRVSGEKGMGRFASQRLGDIIKIISNPENYTGREKTEYGYNTLELTIDWNEYIPGLNFEEIPNKMVMLDTASEHGIKIEITNLKDNWTKKDVDAIVINAGSLISQKFTNKDDRKNYFNVEIIPHGFEPIRTKVESIIEKYAPWQVNAQLIGSKLNFQIFHREQEEGVRIPVVDLTKTFKGRGEMLMGNPTCGNLKLELLIFQGRSHEWAPKAVRKVKELEAQIAENCGVKIFNDDIRIMPYGSKGNDWIGLDKRYLIQATWPRGGLRVRNAQVIGHILLTRKNNPGIKETTTREGLVQNKEYEFLQKRLMIELMQEFELYREEWNVRVDQKKKKDITTKPAAKVKSKISQLTDFVASLDGVKKSDVTIIEKMGKEMLKDVTEVVDIGQKKEDKLTSNLEMYRNLASLGISALSFHHEIRQPIGRISQRQYMLTEKWDKWDDAKKLDWIGKTALDIDTVIEYNAYIREFAVLFSGLKGTKISRQEIKFQDSIQRFKEGFAHILEDFGIEIKVELGFGRLNNLFMNKASWESIMLNLIGNSIKALTNVSRKAKYIKIIFDKSSTHLKISVKDNGAGIEEINWDKIFLPLWSTYRTAADSGTGMGTTIVKEIIEDDYNGTIRVKTSKYEKTYPGKGSTEIEINIPLDRLKKE